MKRFSPVGYWNESGGRFLFFRLWCRYIGHRKRYVPSFPPVYPLLPVCLHGISIILAWFLSTHVRDCHCFRRQTIPHQKIGCLILFCMPATRTGHPDSRHVVIRYCYPTTRQTGRMLWFFSNSSVCILRNRWNRRNAHVLNRNSYTKKRAWRSIKNH